LHNANCFLNDYCFLGGIVTAPTFNTVNNSKTISVILQPQKSKITTAKTTKSQTQLSDIKVFEAHPTLWGFSATHAYWHWLADVRLAGFAPAFTLSLGDSEAHANRQMPIASVVMHKRSKKKEKIR
jgi:hypothetical protein